MFRLGSLALLAVLLSASTAHAIQLRYGDEEFQSTREESALEEDRGAWIDAAATKNPGEAHRVLVKIRADSGSSCAQDPVAEAGAILIDAVHQPGELPPLGRIDTSEPGTVLACGYEFDAAGTAVIDRRSEPIVISPSVAEISLTVVVTTTHRGVPLRVAASARGGRGRLAHVAAIPDATTCPPAAPSPGAPGVQWLTQPTGIALAERGPLALDPWASFTAAGAFTVCGWVSEPGETPAEAVAGGARITIKPGLVSSRIELTAGLTGRRLTWGAHLFGGFSGRFTLEGVRLRSGRPAGAGARSRRCR